MIQQRILTNRVGYPEQSHAVVLSAPLNKQLNMHSVALVDGSGSGGFMGLGHSMNAGNWQYYSWIAGVATQVTSLTNVTLFNTTNNDGFFIQAKDIFGLLTFDLSQASTGSPVFKYEVWNGAAWITQTQFVTNTYNATGKMGVPLAPSYTWVVGNDGTAGLASNLYTMRITATTAPTQAVIASSLGVCKLLTFRSVEAYQGLETSFSAEGKAQLLLNQGEGIVPYFQVASALNAVEFTYRYSG